METIIQKAIEGGWRADFKPNFLMSEDTFIAHFVKTKTQVLDPLFWQALGKASGWGHEKGKYEKTSKKSILRLIDEQNSKKEFYYEGWMHFALNFHEINLMQGWDAAVEWLLPLISPK